LALESDEEEEEEEGYETIPADSSTPPAYPPPAAAISSETISPREALPLHGGSRNDAVRGSSSHRLDLTTGGWGG